jgi:hypothetical protein
VNCQYFVTNSNPSTTLNIVLFRLLAVQLLVFKVKNIIPNRCF